MLKKKKKCNCPLTNKQNKNCPLGWLLLLQDWELDQHSVQVEQVFDEEPLHAIQAKSRQQGQLLHQGKGCRFNEIMSRR